MVSPALEETALHLARIGFDDRAELGEISLIREGPRSRVYRVELLGSKAATTGILKEITDGGECGFSDWASLEYLAGTFRSSTLVPALMEGDVKARCFLMEDLGPSRTLDASLQGSDASATLAALEALGRAYARLHALPTDERRWRRIRGALPAGENLGRKFEVERWLEGRAKLQNWATELGMSRRAMTLTAMQPVARSYRNPGPFLAFTHGDPAPSNNHFSPRGVRLVDFEYGGIRHALYDLTAWNILCPLPEAAVERMVAAYRDEVVGSDSRMAEAPFDAGWAEMCVYRALAMLTWVSPAVLEANRPWVGEWTAREALLAAVGRMVHAAVPYPHLEPVAAFGEAMLARLEARWPEYGKPYVRFPGLDFPM